MCDSGSTVQLSIIYTYLFTPTAVGPGLIYAYIFWEIFKAPANDSKLLKLFGASSTRNYPLVSASPPSHPSTPPTMSLDGPLPKRKPPRHKRSFTDGSVPKNINEHTDGTGIEHLLKHI